MLIILVELLFADFVVAVTIQLAQDFISSRHQLLLLLLIQLFFGCYRLQNQIKLIFVEKSIIILIKLRKDLIHQVMSGLFLVLILLPLHFSLVVSAVAVAVALACLGCSQLLGGTQSHLFKLLITKTQDLTLSA